MNPGPPEYEVVLPTQQGHLVEFNAVPDGQGTFLLSNCHLPISAIRADITEKLRNINTALLR